MSGPDFSLIRDPDFNLIRDCGYWMALLNDTQQALLALTMAYVDDVLPKSTIEEFDGMAYRLEELYKDVEATAEREIKEHS